MPRDLTGTSIGCNVFIMRCVFYRDVVVERPLIVMFPASAVAALGKLGAAVGWHICRGDRRGGDSLAESFHFLRGPKLESLLTDIRAKQDRRDLRGGLTPREHLVEGPSGDDDLAEAGKVADRDVSFPEAGQGQVEEVGAHEQGAFMETMLDGARPTVRAGGF